MQGASMRTDDSSLAIRIRGLSIQYGPKTYGVRDVDLDVMWGEVLGVIGPNGAGKTSLVECVEGLRERSSGEVEVHGIDPARRRREVAAMIGVQLQDTSSPTRCRVQEICDLFASFYADPVPPAGLLEQFELADRAETFVEDLSGGQRQKLSLALCLIGRPRLLFLDELTTGLDPDARRSTWDLLRLLNETGTTIVLTSHFMDEIEALCDRVLLLDGGRPVLLGTIADFLAKCQDQHSYTLDDGLSRVVDATVLERLPGIVSVKAQQRRIVVKGRHPETYDGVRGVVEHSGGDPGLVRHKPPDMEDAFLHLTGRSAEVDDVP